VTAVPAFLVAAEIHLKPGALDPQGQAVGAGLRALGHTEVEDVRVGKHVRLRVRAADADAARAAGERMCRQLLANPVLETYAVEVRPAPDGPADDGTGPP
jgi:phosphoribosylformylglycinamidine synthase